MIYIFLALLNGVCINISRVLIGRLSFDMGPFKASLWSYIVGFLFVTAILLTMGGWRFNLPSEAPVFAYLGGFFGALYVVINAYVFTRLGAIKTVILVVSGQMISGILLDYKGGDITSTLAQFFGVAIIILGVYLARISSLRSEKISQDDIEDLSIKPTEEYR
jgi:transporter family-2 protein